MPKTQPVHEMAREVANMLVRAADEGQPVQVATIREELGLGHEDLEAILDQLRERGMAEEVTPGEWQGRDEAVEEEPGRVRVSVPDDEPEEEEEFSPLTALAGSFSEPTVRLTVAIANALDAEALGKLVKAGIEDTPDDALFVLEIVP